MVEVIKSVNSLFDQVVENSMSKFIALAALATVDTIKARFVAIGS